jgi:hypothetical protein
MALSDAERQRNRRARLAAGIEAGDQPVLRDADDLLVPHVEASIAELGLEGQDLAAAALARLYAKQIDTAKDRGWALRWIGPLLQTALEGLYATPQSRKAQKPAVPQPPNRLHQLRAAHAAIDAQRRRG